MYVCRVFPELKRCSNISTACPTAKTTNFKTEMDAICAEKT